MSEYPYLDSVPNAGRIDDGHSYVEDTVYGKDKFQCENVGAYSHTGAWPTFNYCPWCGSELKTECGHTISEPVTVEWEGGSGDKWLVRVDPYDGSVQVNYRVYPVGVLIAEDVDSAMYHELESGGDGGDE